MYHFKFDRMEIIGILMASVILSLWVLRLKFLKRKANTQRTLRIIRTHDHRITSKYSPCIQFILLNEKVMLTTSLRKICHANVGSRMLALSLVIGPYIV